MTIICSQNAAAHGLTRLLGSAARVAVLRVFLLDPERGYYQRQLAAATEQPIRAIQRELERLTALGLLYSYPEGRRLYYRVDPDYPLYPELRALFLKTATGVERVRAWLSSDRGIRLAFLSEDGDRVLIVPHGGESPAAEGLEGISVEVVDAASFRAALAARSAALAPFLENGVDPLGRRDDALWRHIEAAGYQVRKGDGVP